jgi:hypothetical protein
MLCSTLRSTKRIKWNHDLPFIFSNFFYPTGLHYYWVSPQLLVTVYIILTLRTHRGFHGRLFLDFYVDTVTRRGGVWERGVIWRKSIKDVAKKKTHAFPFKNLPSNDTIAIEDLKTKCDTALKEYHYLQQDEKLQTRWEKKTKYNFSVDCFTKTTVSKANLCVVQYHESMHFTASSEECKLFFYGRKLLINMLNIKWLSRYCLRYYDVLWSLKDILK